MLVPPIYAYFPLSALRTPQNELLGALLERVDSTSVPGATMSGLMRLSPVGPRLLNAASDWAFPDTASFATVAPALAGSGNASGQASWYVYLESPPAVRSLRLAPTTIAFLLVAGEPIDRCST